LELSNIKFCRKFVGFEVVLCMQGGWMNGRKGGLGDFKRWSIEMPVHIKTEVAVVIGCIVVAPLKLNSCLVRLVRGGRWKNVPAHQRLTNTTRTCSQLLCQIRRGHHQTFLQAKNRRSLLQQDLQCCHNLTNSCNLQLSLSRRSEHVSSIGCLSHTHTGENILTDQ
jgi:hypothetical protein